MPAMTTLAPPPVTRDASSLPVAGAPPGRAPAADPTARSARRMTLTVQIVGVAVVALVFSLAVGIFAVAQINRMQSETAVMVDNETSVNAALTDFQAALWGVRMNAGMVAAYADADGKAAQLEALQTGYGDVEATMAAFDAAYLEAFGADVEGWTELESAWAEYRGVLEDQLVPAAMADDRAAYAQVRDGSAGEKGGSSRSWHSRAEATTARTLRSMERGRTFASERTAWTEPVRSASCSAVASRPGNRATSWHIGSFSA